MQVIKYYQVENQVYWLKEIVLYEKYGFTFWQTMTTREGKPTRAYVRNFAL